MATTRSEETKSLSLVGLTDDQVLESRRTHGENVLTPPERDPWWKLYLEKYEDPVIRILMIAAVIAIGVGAMHGEYIEGIGIIIAVLLATTLAFLNEYKAGREFDILNKVNDDVPIKVIRNGNVTTVPRRELVVGDVALLDIGEEVPADATILEAVSLQVDEARLTGESVPVSKLSRDDAKGFEGERTYPVDRVLRGTMVADGHATVEITGVGDKTEIGKIIEESSDDDDEITPLNAQLDKLSRLIGVVGLTVAGAVYGALVLRGYLQNELALNLGQWYFTAVLTLATMIALAKVWLPIVFDGLEFAGKKREQPSWLQAEGLAAWAKMLLAGAVVFGVGLGAGILTGIMSSDAATWLPGEAGRQFLTYFMVAVTIIVVAVPEGLAMSVTLSLAYSMRKMTAANNLVRRMNACETIGAATVICSDKTGTLTMNEMRVYDSVFPASSGGEFTPLLRQLIDEGVAANSTSHLSREDGGELRPVGNPTEGALLLWIASKGSDYAAIRKAFRVKRQWTFSTERKFMGTLGSSSSRGKVVLHVKGAPEIVLDRCSTVLTGTGIVPIGSFKEAISAELHGYQRRGMRTLALAFAEGDELPHEGDLESLAHGLTWLGFFAIADPVRDEVPDAVKACRAAGIHVKIVTGDNPETAREVGRSIGLWDGEPREEALTTGALFHEMDDEQATEALEGLHVLSRARPLDKMRMVNLLKDAGHVVAVTGDGVNDGPALNRADVGLAMGKTGTSVAKEASDIILLDDSFRSIVNAVMWGRSLYENIQRFILFQLTINVAALGIALLGPFIGVKLPLTVIQMLWVNLIMDTFAALALATEPPDWGVMRRPPRKPTDFIISPTMARGVFGVGGLFVVVLAGLLLYLQQGGGITPLELSIFFTTFVMLQFWNLFNARMLGRANSAFKGITQNKAFLLIAASIFMGQVLITQFGGSVFRTEPLTAMQWLAIVGATSAVLWIGEIGRMFAGRKVATA
jgi:Ca2+-transporting ATPase